MVRTCPGQAEAEAPISLLSEELGEQLPPWGYALPRKSQEEVERPVSCEDARRPRPGLHRRERDRERVGCCVGSTTLSPLEREALRAGATRGEPETLPRERTVRPREGAFTDAWTAEGRRSRRTTGRRSGRDRRCPPPSRRDFSGRSQEASSSAVGGNDEVRGRPDRRRRRTGTWRWRWTEAVSGQDLLYRLGRIPVDFPDPARAVKTIAPSRRALPARVRRGRGRRCRRISPMPRKAALTAYRWPGNIRELQNVIEANGDPRTGGNSSTPLLKLRGRCGTSERRSIPGGGIGPGRGRSSLRAGDIRKGLSARRGEPEVGGEILGISLRTLDAPDQGVRPVLEGCRLHA